MRLDKRDKSKVKSVSCWKRYILVIRTKVWGAFCWEWERKIERETYYLVCTRAVGGGVERATDDRWGELTWVDMYVTLLKRQVWVDMIETCFAQMNEDTCLKTIVSEIRLGLIDLSLERSWRGSDWDKRKRGGGGLRGVRTGKSAVCSHVVVMPGFRAVTMSQTGTKIQSFNI